MTLDLYTGMAPTYICHHNLLNKIKLVHFWTTMTFSHVYALYFLHRCDGDIPNKPSFRGNVWHQHLNINEPKEICLWGKARKACSKTTVKHPHQTTEDTQEQQRFQLFLNQRQTHHSHKVDITMFLVKPTNNHGWLKSHLLVYWNYISSMLFYLPQITFICLN